jgi:hypothetical protein
MPRVAVIAALLAASALAQDKPESLPAAPRDEVGNAKPKAKISTAEKNEAIKQLNKRMSEGRTAEQESGYWTMGDFPIRERDGVRSTKSGARRSTDEKNKAIKEMNKDQIGPMQQSTQPPGKAPSGGK